MRTVLLSPFYPVSNQLDTSHRAGWARYWANELTHQGQKTELLTTETMKVVDELKKGDQVLCYHGMEFKGQLNLQSGLTDEILERAGRLIGAAKRGVDLISLDEPMPNYGRLLGERGLDPTSASKLSNACGKAKTLLVPNREPEAIVVGDSHSLAMYSPGTTILRQDAKTMHGALEFGLCKLVDVLQFEMEVSMKKVKRLSFYYGNIDIRHHLLRQPHPKASMQQMVDKYITQLKVVRSLTKKPIEIILPLGIESETRVLPKSIMFKGTPYYGSRLERIKMVSDMRALLRRRAKKEGFDVYDHPPHFGEDRNAHKLTMDVMEKPRSVHIRPAEYRLVQEGHEWLV